MNGRRAEAVPRATYRVQLNAGFTFDDAIAILPYLRSLGISHLYTSPVLQAAPGSTHGYDVVDHGRVSRELGGEEGFERLTDALRAHGMGLVLDIVPNHMSICCEENRWWWDVLEHGRQSRYAAYFDVEWDGAVLLPILPDRYDRVLAAGEIRLVRDGDQVLVSHAGRRFPLKPQTAAGLQGADEAGLDAAVASVNRDPSALHALLEQQHYRLAHWRSAATELGYRRFLDINELIGLRVEDERVFADTHARILGWVGEGRVQGLRVDHPDGLRDPAAYFSRLRVACGDTWIVAEKILQDDEELQADWPVDGTTGYGFANLATGLLVDPDGEAALDAAWMDHAAVGSGWEQIEAESRAEVLATVLGSDMKRLAHSFAAACEAERAGQDAPADVLGRVLREVAGSLPVYRTYVRGRDKVVTSRDAGLIDEAAAAAAGRCPDLDPELFILLGRILRLESPGQAAIELALRFQQLTPAAMVKGVEDTAFYRHLRLVALNEVGGDPDRFGIRPDAFHQTMSEQQRTWPSAMLALSTHDSKRSADVRARLAVLSEDGDGWRAAAASLSAVAGRHRRAPDVPSRGDEYLLLQTLVGAWPIDPDRVVAYLVKAGREAKLLTSWAAPNLDYETALADLARACLADEVFTDAIRATVGPLVEAGRVASLAQVALQLTAPGVPDLYQGSELWEHTLVDPDNRRPIDYAELRGLLAEAASLGPAEAWERGVDGTPKLWLIHRALELRRRRPAAFGPAGTYDIVTITGAAADAAVAFVRGGVALTVVPCRPWRIAATGWRDTGLNLPQGAWRSLDGSEWTGPTRLAELLAPFPVALMERV